MVLRSIFKRKKKDVLYTNHIENGVGWNKNICKLSCEKFLRIMCILCHKNRSDLLLLNELDF